MLIQVERSVEFPTADILLESIRLPLHVLHPPFALWETLTGSFDLTQLSTESGVYTATRVSWTHCFTAYDELYSINFFYIFLVSDYSHCVLLITCSKHPAQNQTTSNFFRWLYKTLETLMSLWSKFKSIGHLRHLSDMYFPNCDPFFFRASISPLGYNEMF